MLRRNPTRIEHKIDDLEEFENFKKEKENEVRKQKLATLSDSSLRSRTETIHARIGYDPKPLETQGAEGIPGVFDPLKAGSIDGTDTEPHDHAIFTAMNSKYKPNTFVTGNPETTVFVARLNRFQTNEESLKNAFEKFGKIKRIRIVRNVVTGFSQGYAFIEYDDISSALFASRDGNHMIVDDFELFVDMECERTLKGWIPRRMGGGFGGKKESGQLRFGCKDRPFRRPFLVENKQGYDRKERAEYSGDREYYKRNENEYGDRYGSMSSKERDRRHDYRKRRRSRSRSSSRKRTIDSSREDHRRRHRD